MSCSSVILLICMFMALSLATLDPDSTKERSVTESVPEARQDAAEDLGSLLDAGDGAVITLEAGGTRLAVHRAVLAARSPALAALLRHHSGRLIVPGVDGAVLRRLLAYLYTLRAPWLPPGAATQLLAAAHRFGLQALQADCEQQVTEQLSVETAASVAVLAVKHSLTDLRDAAINFIKDHFVEVLATKGWADAVENQPREVIKVTLLLAGRLAGTTAPVNMQPGNTTSMAAETTATIEGETSSTMEAGIILTIEAGNSTNVDGGITAISQPHSGPSQPPATAAPPLAACPTSPLDEATVSRLRSLSGEERDRRLIQAAMVGTVGDLRALLAAGADVGARGKEESTALFWAALAGDVEAASCLLRGGAQVDATNLWQKTPLHMAAAYDYVAVVRLLLAASADPNARDVYGSTPLHLAALFGRAKATAALLEAGSDRDAKDVTGKTPLYYARFMDQQQLIDMLTQP